jgi:hypothetical protein
MVNAPVYLSETVTINYSFPQIGNSLSFGYTLGFYDSSGNLLGTGCSAASSTPSLIGTVSCSTGLVLIGGPSIINLNDSFGAGIVVFSPGDSASFKATATLGPLDVYDASGNLIEVNDLNSLPAAAPEPASLILLGTGLVCIVVVAKTERRS